LPPTKSPVGAIESEFRSQGNPQCDSAFNGRALVENHAKEYSIITKSNIQSYILDAVEVSARAAALFDFGRGAKEHPPQFVTRERMQQILRFSIFDDAEVDEIVEKFDLKGSQRWGDRWLSA
ncbi:hypothetical protein, partial [Agrobacterium sp. 22-226-1]